MRHTVIGYVECWAPECAAQLEQLGGKRPRRYCDAACKQRAFRRNGGKSPTEPYTAANTPPPRVAAPKPAPKPVTKPPRKTKVKTPAPALFSDAEPVASPAAAREVASSGVAPAPVPGPTVGEPAPESTPPVVLVPPPPPEPEPEPPSDFYLSVVAELEEMGQLNSRRGQQALTMARRLEDRSTSAAATATISKELDRFLAELKISAPKKTDAGEIIGDRVRNKLIQASQIGAVS